MESSARTQRLKEISAGTPCAHKDIYYKGRNEVMPVYNIDLDCLIYNQYNGRIATFVKTHEKDHGTIDATTPNGEALIEKFLWESKKTRNKRTLEDLNDRGQLEYGIVTADGVVIDGNRRYMLLKKLKTEKQEGTGYFKAIILPDTLESKRKEIMQLETTYQMGVDDKVDYNPIQKYLKCRDLKSEDFRIDEIAKMMGETATTIEEYLSILDLMDEYLREYGYEGIYRILETEKLEGHFVDLNNYMARYNSGRQLDIDWIPEKEDLDDVKKVYFDYMRADFGVHDVRIIANPAKDKGLFTKKDLWDGFVKKHYEAKEEAGDEESTLEEKREKNPDTEVTTLIHSHDSEYKKNIESNLKGNLGRSKRELDDQNSQDEPLELLVRACRTLEKINPDVESFQCQEVRDVSHTIRKMAERFIKIVDGKAKV